MRIQTGTAILQPIRRIGKITPARLTQTVERTIAEQTVEIVRICPGMTRKKLAFPMCKILIVLFFQFDHAFLSGKNLLSSLAAYIYLFSNSGTGIGLEK